MCRPVLAAIESLGSGLPKGVKILSFEDLETDLDYQPHENTVAGMVTIRITKDTF